MQAPSRLNVKGLRIFTCGHSFHVWTKELLSEIAAAAGIIGHQAVGLSSIGGSRVIQHWDVPDETNELKQALRKGGVDVLTLAPIWLPDEGIANFTRLASSHNPDVRVMVQEFWLPNDEYAPIYPLNTRKVVDHNATDMQRLKADHQQYFDEIETHIRAINSSLGKQVAFIVPVAQAVLGLRELILSGDAPSLKRQSELFTDSWGHVAEHIKVLSAYCHFAVIYGSSPVGLPVPSMLNTMPEPEAKALNRVLQKLAWRAVTSHPMTGVKS